MILKFLVAITNPDQFISIKLSEHSKYLLYL